MCSWDLKTNRICALDDPFDSIAMHISISIRTLHILPTGMMKLWYNHIDARSRGVVYLDISCLVGPKTKRICALDDPFDSTAMHISISIRTYHILPTGMMKLRYNHLAARSRRVVYLHIPGLVGP